MYTTVQSSRRWNTAAPRICLLLLGLLVFTTAATTVSSGRQQDTYRLSENIATGNLRGAQVNNAGGYNSRKRKRRQTDTSTSSDDEVTNNITLIIEYWGNISPYEDNSPDAFGVVDTGLPAGCQVEQAHVLHRHGGRYPAGSENGQILVFTGKANAGKGGFTGPLSFINTWTNRLGTDVLVPEGARIDYASGIGFWVKYGRLLYNAQPGQTRYNATGQTTPLLRCNNEPRVNDSAHAWASGFFGLYNPTDKYSLLVIPVATGVNNTLASFVACTNFFNTSYGIFDSVNALYYPIGYYLTNATARLNQYAPPGVNFTVFDAFVMQQLCAYEYVALGSSDYCSLFTLNEWRGFDYTLDLYVYNGYSFGSPQGRSIGIGILEELIARLTNQMITTSDSSVNSTLDSSTTTFPLGQKFYLDMSHDVVIVGLLTAMSMDYFRQNLEINDFPPPADRHFKTKYIVPYAARLITEKIGCVSSNPTATNSKRTQYTSTQYGYSAATATNKFIRMRLNNGILPLDTIRGGFCAGRTDGLCPLSSFIASQANASTEANYDELCFGNYVYNSSGFTGDGNYFPA